MFLREIAFALLPITMTYDVHKNISIAPSPPRNALRVLNKINRAFNGDHFTCTLSYGSPLASFCVELSKNLYLSQMGTILIFCIGHLLNIYNIGDSLLVDVGIEQCNPFLQRAHAARGGKT